MVFWTKENISRALPDAKFYNFPDSFFSNGVRVTHLDFERGNMALVRKSDEKVGIAESFLDSLTDKVSAIICSDYEYFSNYNLPVIEVNAPYDSVIKMAEFIRKQYNGKVIDITGSSGKTTATKMCYDVLSHYGASANLNQANTNFGLAWNMTLYDVNMPYWVNETSLGGGMDLNSALTIPDIAVVTNIAPVHLKPNQPLINVAVQKSKIFSSMKPGSLAFLYKEMEYYDVVERAPKKKNLRIITFGESEDSDIRVLIGSRNSLNIFGRLYAFNDSPTPRHILLDAAIVAGIVYSLGLSIEEAIEKLREFNAIVGRGQVTEGNIDSAHKITMVDESFNANPLSMKFSLEGFNRLYGSKENKLLILGDMAEGGPETLKQHLYLFKYIEEIKPSRVLLCGEQMANLWDLVNNAYDGAYYRSVNELLPDVLNWIKNDDYIFIKASHSIELFKVVIKLRDMIRNFNK